MAQNNAWLKSSVWFLVCVLASSASYADRIYAVYSGNQNGVTVRDADTLVQEAFFDPGFTINGIAAGTRDDMYLTGGNTIYHYSHKGDLLNSFTFTAYPVTYHSVAVGDGQIYVAYQGNQIGITVRDATTLLQDNVLITSVVNQGVGSALSTDIYRVAGYNITRYDNVGQVLQSYDFPVTTIIYTNVDVGKGVIFASYSGSQNGVTVRDASDVATQLNLFNPGFTTNGLAAGDSDDLYLTNANKIYHYTAGGQLISSFTFPDAGIVYGDIAFAKVDEPRSILPLLIPILKQQEESNQQTLPDGD